MKANRPESHSSTGHTGYTSLTGTQAHRHTGTQAHRHTGTQAHSHTGTQPHRHTATQTHLHHGLPHTPGLYRHTNTDNRHRHRHTDTDNRHRHTDTQTTDTDIDTGNRHPYSIQYTVWHRRPYAPHTPVCIRVGPACSSLNSIALGFHI
jgi:hypothetical protein